MVSSQALRLFVRFLCVSGSDWGSFISERHQEGKKRHQSVFLSVTSGQASMFYKKHFFLASCAS